MLSNKSLYHFAQMKSYWPEFLHTHYSQHIKHVCQISDKSTSEFYFGLWHQTNVHLDQNQDFLWTLAGVILDLLIHFWSDFFHVHTTYKHINVCEKFQIHPIHNSVDTIHFLIQAKTEYCLLWQSFILAGLSYQV